MQEIVLHLGLHKTGTTYLQRTLFASKAALREAGVLYPGHKFNLNVLGTTFARDPLSTRLSFKWRGSVEELLAFEAAEAADLERELRESGCGRALISAEELSLLGVDEVARLVAWLRGMCPNVRAVAYVRDTADWSTSFASQLIRRGALFGEVCADPPVPAYRQRLKPWADALGERSVTVRSYEQAMLGPGGLLGDLLQAACVPPEAVAADTVAARLNPSLSMEAVLLLDALRARRPVERGDTFDRACVRALSAIPGAAFALPPAALREAVARSEADAAWLHVMFGVKVTNEVPDGAAVSRPEWGPDTVAELARLITDLVARDPEW